jgi:hemerythrin
MDFQKRYQAGQVALSVEMMNFLKDWLTNHIVETDKRYIPYLTK